MSLVFKNSAVLKKFFSKKPKSEETWGGLLFFLLIVILFRSFLYSPFKIPSGSMIPTLLVGDHIVVSKFSYGWSRYSILFSGWINYFSGRVGKIKIKRGDVAVFAYPNDVTTDYIKRVVGLPGDKVQMIAGILHINGQPVAMKQVSKEKYMAHDGIEPIEGIVYEETFPQDNKPCEEKPHLILKQIPFGNGPLDNTPEIVLSDTQYYMMGDNRDGSADSRAIEHLGPVDEKYMIGPALFIWLSFDTSFSWFKPWLWPFQIRYHRFFQKIE